MALPAQMGSMPPPRAPGTLPCAGTQWEPLRCRQRVRHRLRWLPSHLWPLSASCPRTNTAGFVEPNRGGIGGPCRQGRHGHPPPRNAAAVSSRRLRGRPRGSNGQQGEGDGLGARQGFAAAAAPEERQANRGAGERGGGGAPLSVSRRQRDAGRRAEGTMAGPARGGPEYGAGTAKSSMCRGRGWGGTARQCRSPPARGREKGPCLCPPHSRPGRDCCGPPTLPQR